MELSAIQFKKGLSFSWFQKLCGTKAQCQVVLAQMRWPHGFRWLHCEGAAHGLVCVRSLSRL